MTLSGTTSGTLPNLLLIGAPKAGTTALHVALARHPQLWMSRVKEPKYFLCDGAMPAYRGPGDARTARQSVWRAEDYRALFADAPPGTMIGESTSLYLADPAAHARIAQALPDVRLIAVLRDPIERAHSNWTHLRSAGLEPEDDFLRACDLEEERQQAGWAPFWRFLGLGRYGEQLTSLFSVFPRERVLVLRYRDLRTAPVDTLDRICAFLGVEEGRLTELPAANVTADTDDSFLSRVAGAALRAAIAVEHRLPERWWRALDRSIGRHLQRGQRRRAPLTADQRAALIPRIADDVRVLETVIGESFATWLDPTNADLRATLSPRGRIGTAHGNIDRPLSS